MLCWPKAAEPLVDSFESCVPCSRPTFQRLLLLSVGAILAMGRRTITGILWTVRTLARGHISSYHRVFSRSPWSPWALSRVLAAIILELIPDDRLVVLSVDDTTAMHKGKNVYGKGCHHDACRSTQSHTVFKWGHKWVVLAIHVTFPFSSRPWALPVLCALYKPKELNTQEGRRHRTPTDLAKGLVAALIHRFPGRKFVLLGDGGYASHDLASFARRHRRHLTLISRFHPDANLYGPPPQVRRSGPKGGKPRSKGPSLPQPQNVVPSAKRARATVDWYGGQKRRVEHVSQTGHWYKSGGGLVEVRWVFVHDLDGTHRDEYFYSTDPGLSPAQIISLFTARWSIEVTFQEVREHLGFETTRQWKEKSVLRSGPWLMGLFSVVSLIYARLCERRTPRIRTTPWYDKSEPTFSDALFAVRRALWQQTVLKQAVGKAVVSKLPSKFKAFVLDRLAAVA
jgi:hypothetical protein